MFGEHLEITVSFFTFHNVSINTSDSGDKLFYLLPLHSTMFLLIHTSYPKDVKIVHFTFHNVSINTVVAMLTAELAILFTFHNVSINTILSPDIFCLHGLLLYIPQCFY